MKKYTQKEIRLAAKLIRAADEGGIIRPEKMLKFTNEPTMHTTMSVSSAFFRLTGKQYDTDYFCDK